jgi:hypothetical protein
MKDMKKFLLGFVFVLTVGLLSGCAIEKDIFNEIERSVESLGDINQDSSIEDVESLSLALGFDEVINLAYTEEEIAFFEAKTSLLLTHYELQATKFSTRGLVLEVKLLVREMRETQVSLTEADKNLVLESIALIKEYRLDILEDATEGYLKLKDLRENPDDLSVQEMIIILNEVNVVLTNRTENLDKINSELAKIKDILS